MSIREIVAGILALLMFLYSFVVFKIHSGSGTFLLFFALGIFFAACALGLHFGVWDRSPVWLRRLFLAVVIFSAAVFLFVEMLILSGFSADGEDNLDYIIVLGERRHCHEQFSCFPEPSPGENAGAPACMRHRSERKPGLPAGEYAEGVSWSGEGLFVREPDLIQIEPYSSE